MGKPRPRPPAPLLPGQQFRAPPCIVTDCGRGASTQHLCPYHQRRAEQLALTAPFTPRKLARLADPGPSR